MDRLFRFDMYPADWLLDTSALNAEELAIFTQIIMLFYARRGDLDNDPSFISQKIRDMSTRKARSLIQKLVEKNFIQINSEGKITQKRAENELKTKRTHLEHSAKGGRTKAENQSQHSKNKALVSSGNSESLATPSPIATAIASPLKKDDELTIPENLDPQTWNDFVSSRKLLKKPMTTLAKQRMLKKLADFDSKGFDINALLDLAIQKGWQDVYDPKDGSCRKKSITLKTTDHLYGELPAEFRMTEVAHG